ncbi:MAG: hypothetical protein AAFX94_03940, partial [Myxococcota bacterium]
MTLTASGAYAGFWDSDGQIDESSASISVQGGTLGLNDALIAEVPVNLTSWLAVGPYAVGVAMCPPSARAPRQATAPASCPPRAMRT